ncbi:hypothetical protein L1887_11000 [Cichorium endivia]|nr:hypothetical protein L1887_11000 [Cichorium endivia]
MEESKTLKSKTLKSSNDILKSEKSIWLTGKLIIDLVNEGEDEDSESIIDMETDSKLHNELGWKLILEVSEDILKSEESILGLNVVAMSMDVQIR